MRFRRRRPLRMTFKTKRSDVETVLERTELLRSALTLCRAIAGIGKDLPVDMQRSALRLAERCSAAALES